MARRESSESKQATLAEVLTFAKEVEGFTSDPLEPIDYLNSSGSNAEVENFRTALNGLIDAIGHLPRRTRTAKERAARAEAETLRSACELFEIACDHSSAVANAEIELRKALIVLDTALVRFAVLAD